MHAKRFSTATFALQSTEGTLLSCPCWNSPTFGPGLFIARHSEIYGADYVSVRSSRVNIMKIPALRSVTSDIANFYTIGQFIFGAFALFAAGGAGAWITYGTDWLNQFGRVSWLFVGIVILVAIIASAWGVAKIRLVFSVSKLNDSRSRIPTRINILKDSFEQEVIETSDLWNSLRPAIKGKRFHRCRFQGPMTVYFLDCNVSKGSFTSCNFVEIGDSLVHGVVAFEDCIFTECEFDCVTILLHESEAAGYRKGFNGNMNFLARPST